ncbi:MAG: hypothetical protein KDB47_19405 [Mycobacterium sp.]|nr:hypothetical protein [Mycobacterium sp.]
MGRSIPVAAFGAAVALTAAVTVSTGVAVADDEVWPAQDTPTSDEVQPTDVVQPDGGVQPEGGAQHNVTYRARVDGLARGALITYRISDAQVNSADPTMLPGRTFEATAVLSDPSEAGMRISIQWPYSANLHCEILVDDQLFAQADQFIGPKLTPARDDPDYGAMQCGAPLSNAPGLPADELPLPPPVPGDGTADPLQAPSATAPAEPSAADQFAVVN